MRPRNTGESWWSVLKCKSVLFITVMGNNPWAPDLNKCGGPVGYKWGPGPRPLLPFTFYCLVLFSDVLLFRMCDLWTLGVPDQLNNLNTSKYRPWGHRSPSGHISSFLAYVWVYKEWKGFLGRGSKDFSHKVGVLGRYKFSSKVPALLSWSKLSVVYLDPLNKNSWLCPCRSIHVCLLVVS